MNHENINHADLKLFREKFRPLYAAVKDSGFCRQFAAKKIPALGAGFDDRPENCRS